MKRLSGIMAPAVVLASFLSLTAPGIPQSHEYGYSYLHIDVSGRAVTNFVHDEKYVGWLQVESVTVEGLPAPHPSAGKSTTSVVKKIEAERWTTAPAFFRSERGGAGTLHFAAGDSGVGLDPSSTPSEFAQANVLFQRILAA